MLHASQCLECAEKLVTLQTAILRSRQVDTLETTLGDLELALLADKYLALGEVALKQSKEFAVIRQHPGNLARFQQLVAYLQAPHAPDDIKAPESLKSFVRNSLDQSVTEVGKAPQVFLRIQNGLKVLADAAAGILVLPDIGEAVPVRSVASTEVPRTGSMVQFLTPSVPNGKIQEGRILYQAVQDSTNTVMLTVRLQDCLPLPRIINIKREGRIIYSYPVKEEYTYFPQLVPGSYLIELKDQFGAVIRQLQVEVILGDN